MSIRNLILALAADPPKRLPVTIGGQSLFAVEMNAAQRDTYETAQHEANERRRAETGDGKFPLVNFRARLLAHALVDADCTRVFTDADAEDLAKLPARHLRDAFLVAAKLNPIGDADPKAAAKNS